LIFEGGRGWAILPLHELFLLPIVVYEYFSPLHKYFFGTLALHEFFFFFFFFFAILKPCSNFFRYDPTPPIKYLMVHPLVGGRHIKEKPDHWSDFSGFLYYDLIAMFEVLLGEFRIQYNPIGFGAGL